jgi:hypothetical protein
MNDFVMFPKNYLVVYSVETKYIIYQGINFQAKATSEV